MEYFGLKLGQDLGNRAAHPYQEFRGVPPPLPRARDSPRFVFQFSRAAANHFLRKNLRNLRSGTMVATVACRFFPSVKRRILTDSAREILLSGDWTCQESFLDSWITPHVYKDIALFLRFFCHISSLRDVTIIREI